jgi:hypothetical protein
MFIGALVTALFASTPASALCIYDGVDNAKTTIQQELADSKWVVRARVLSAVDGEIRRGGDAGLTYTLYWLRVIHAYKGHPPARLTFFTTRDSGGFYLDRAWVPLPAGHDVGTDYLLFLNPLAPFRGQPVASKGAVFVNYSCGQSKRWSTVPASSKRLLLKLSR